MSAQAVLLPVFVLIGLAFALLLGMATMRTETLKSGETPIKDIALGQSNWPLRTTQIGNCFSNQFEVPVLFYLLCTLLSITKLTTMFLLACAWGFVTLRCFHAYIHLTHNTVIRRFQTFLAGSFVLFVMWVAFAVRLIQIG